MVKIDKNTFKKTFKIVLVAFFILLYFLFSLSDEYSIILGTIIHFLVEFIGNYLYKK